MQILPINSVSQLVQIAKLASEIPGEGCKEIAALCLAEAKRRIQKDDGEEAPS